MKLNSSLYDLTQQTQGQIFATIKAIEPQRLADLPSLPPLLQIRSGHAESPGWFMIQAAEFDPEPLTVENLRVRDIYASERIVQAILEMLAGEGWLDRMDEAYHLTSAGRTLINQRQDGINQLLSTANPSLPTETMNQLLARLEQIIELSLKSSTPPGNWCLAHSRNRAPSEGSAPLVRINQYFSDFNAFRDDAHMAAWQAQAVEGYVWEAFSLIHSGQATTANEVYDALIFRGYSRSDYAAALHALQEKGWVVSSNDADRYEVSDLGQQIWQKVEQLTDEYFYAPWSELADDEIEETINLLQQFYDELQGLATDEGA